MHQLGSVIAARVAEWGSIDLANERALFGSVEPAVIAAAVDAWCRAHLGSAIERYEFFESSAGSVHGVVLADGRAVVVKGHRPIVGAAYLDAMQALQADLADHGYPAPRPLVAPTPYASGHLTAEEMLRCATRDDGHLLEVRGALARGLAEFIELAHAHRDALAAVAFPMAVPDGSLYPVPHSSRFDFDATRAGAEWIDDLAGDARAQLRERNAGRSVVAHGDWRAENVCVHNGRLNAVYDWDSVHVAREPVALAPAAVTFSVDWARPVGTHFPTPREIGAFIADYEDARGAPFNDEERSVLAAAIVASLAYGARCEHADRDTLPSGADSFRGLLGRLGRPLLDRGLETLTRI